MKYSTIFSCVFLSITGVVISKTCQTLDGESCQFPYRHNYVRRPVDPIYFDAMFEFEECNLHEGIGDFICPTTNDKIFESYTEEILSEYGVCDKDCPLRCSSWSHDVTCNKTCIR